MDRVHLLSVLGLLFVGYALFFAPAGFLTTDEFIYAAMTDRLLNGGSFFFANGYAETPSPTLRLLFLTPTSQGLTAQYPAGYAFLAAPFYLAGGIRGLIVLNTLAAIGLIVLTYRLALALFEDKSLALNAALVIGFASFLADYAFAVLPHATAGLFMVSAAYFAARAAKAEDFTAKWFVLAGLMIGLGINIRVDTIMFAPLLAAWFIATMPRPIKAIAAFAGGMVPGFAGAAYLNFLRFGRFNPLTYGLDDRNGSGGLATLGAYGELLPFLVIGGLAAIALGLKSVRDLFLGWKGFLIAVAAIAVLAVLPATAGLMGRLLKGLYVLLIDLQSYDYIDRYSGGSTLIDGKWILFSGNVKKALFESLPYAGFFILPLAKIFQARQRAAYGLCLMLPFAWFAFFAIHQWHGGQSTNMRYFSTQLPFLAILAAIAWHELSTGRSPSLEPSFKGRYVLLALGLAGLVVVWLNVDLVANLYLLGLGRWLFYLAALVALMVLLSPSVRLLLPVGRGVFYVTMAFGLYAAVGHDLRISYLKRSWQEANRSDCRAIERDALVIANLPGVYYCHLLRPGGRLAVLKGDTGFIDYPMLDHVLAKGQPVYVTTKVKEALAAQPRGKRYDVTETPGPDGMLHRLRLRSR